MKPAQFSCYLNYAVQTFLLKRENPFLFAMMLTDLCNLDCHYCVSKNSGKFCLDLPGTGVEGGVGFINYIIFAQ